MDKVIRIVIADDYPLFREGLHLLLFQFKQFEICGEAGDGEKLLQEIEEKQPDVVITDIQMPVKDGIEVTKIVKEKYPAMKVIALTMFGDEHLIADMMEAGANGYILKNTPKEELAEAIQAVYNGGIYFCNNSSMQLNKMLASIKTPFFRNGHEVVFSTKEKEIINLICEEYASKQIASMTALTHRTVEKYRDRIMEKTGARNVVGIVIYAIRHDMYKV
ncbi:MAG TPA: response regulator transcription factor [Chitinophagaceae bacterium]